ncbi:hypothetical protein GCM10027348_30830 [Hymenobacter tenuis]
MAYPFVYYKKRQQLPELLPLVRGSGASAGLLLICYMLVAHDFHGINYAEASLIEG